MELTCQKCGRQWEYRGRRERKRTSCPSCHTSVTIFKTPKPAPKFVSPSVPVRQSKDDLDSLLEGLADSPGSSKPEFRKKPSEKSAEFITSTDPRDVESPRQINFGPGLVGYKGRRARKELFGKLIGEPGLGPLQPEQLFNQQAPAFEQERRVFIPERSRWPYLI